MRLFFSLFMFCFSFSLSAAPLTSTYALLEPGTRLVWDFGIWNYYIHQGEVPSYVRVSLAGPAGQTGTLAGWIESPNGLESTAFALEILQGEFSRNGGSTPLSYAIGDMDIPNTLWGSTAHGEISARLIVEGTYTIGRGSPYMASSAVGVSLNGAGVSMGTGPVSGVREIEAINIPEPASWILIGMGFIYWIARNRMPLLFTSPSIASRNSRR